MSASRTDRGLAGPWAASVRLAALLLLATLLLPRGSVGDTAGTGTFDISIDTTFGFPAPETGLLTWDDQTYDALGLSMVNLGQSVVTMDITGIVGAGAGSPPSGAFFGTLNQPGILQIVTSGDFVCPLSVGGCTGSFVASFVGEVSSMTGTLVGGSPGQLPAPGSLIAYTVDGFSDCLTNAGSIDCTGNIALNVFAAQNTPVGAPVSLTIDTSFFNPITEEFVPFTAEVSFAQVNAAGTTLVTPVSDAAGDLPPNIEVLLPGFGSVFFFVSTSATVVGPIRLCGPTQDSNGDGLVDGTEVHECSMRILHKEGETFVDRTLLASDPLCPAIDPPLCPFDPALGGAPCIDQALSRICGSVPNLSLFVIAIDTNAPSVPMPVPTLPGGVVLLVLLLLGATLWVVQRHQTAHV